MRMFSKHYKITYWTGIKRFGILYAFVMCKKATVQSL